MNNKPLFSIVLLHYNQPSFVEEALNSILCQSYENIQLVFADDASKNINLQQIKDYVESNKGANIKEVIWHINSQNQGTVKTLNGAIQKCTGEYLLFFAADDKLYDEFVIENFSNSFNEVPNDVYMISSQCYMMDINLEKKLYEFVKSSFAGSFNDLPAIEQYKVFTRDCFLAIGATAMRMSMFSKFGQFNEKYKLVEDWSYFLHLTRSGGRINYKAFNGLLHRDGGVSHYKDNKFIPPHVLQYKQDMINIFQTEIIPYIKSFTSHEKNKILEWYESEVKGYLISGGSRSNASQIFVLKTMPIYSIKRSINNTVTTTKTKTILRLDKLSKISMLWISVMLFYLMLTQYQLFDKTPEFAINALKGIIGIISIVTLYHLVKVTFLVLLKWLYSSIIFAKSVFKKR